MRESNGELRGMKHREEGSEGRIREEKVYRKKYREEIGTATQEKRKEEWKKKKSNNWLWNFLRDVKSKRKEYKEYEKKEEEKRLEKLERKEKVVCILLERKMKARTGEKER